MEEIKQFYKKEVKIDHWMSGVKNYISEVTDNMIVDKSLIIVMKSQNFQTNTEPQRNVTFIVRSNHTAFFP